MTELLYPGRLARYTLFPLLLLSAAACGPDAPDVEPSACRGRLAGDLVITEVMANPAGTDSGSGAEWFEIYNATSSPIDLSGITLVYEAGDDQSSHVIEDISIEAGGYLTVGAVLTEFKPDYIDYGFANDLGSLRNGGATLRIVCDDTEVDTLEYPDMSASSSDGVSMGFDGNMSPDHLLNDNPINLCSATTEFSPGLFGTPGAANDPCEVIVPGQCMDAGGDFRDVNKPVIGDLVISELMPNPGGTDGDREWFEIYVVNPVDLNGLLVGRSTTGGTDTDAINATECLSFAAGEYALIAKDRDPLVNNGLPEVDGVFGFSMLQSGGDVFLESEGTVLDTVTWASSTSNTSIQLDVGKLDPDENDLAENWCDGTTPIGNEDFGTPGVANLDCNIIPPDTCLDGGVPRAKVAPGPGDLTITEVMANPAGTESNEEWIEVRVENAVDLNGLQLGDSANPTDETYDSPNCLRFGAGEFVLFARKSDPGVNGGLPTVDFTFGFALNNNADETITLTHGATTLDTWVDPDANNGEANQLDVDGVICPAETAYGTTSGNLGTPKAANDVDCP